MIKVNEMVHKTAMDQSKALSIASLNVWEIIQKLNNGTLTSLEVVVALISRTASIGRSLKLITETNFVYGIEAAIKCD